MLTVNSVIRLKDKDPDVKLKNIPEREYDLFSNGFFGRKEAENYDKQFFKWIRFASNSPLQDLKFGIDL